VLIGIYLLIIYKRMLILNTLQVRELDRLTILHQEILSSELMERAASACTEWILNNCALDSNFVVICGKGNNGGDGLAIARQLHLKKYTVSILLLDGLRSIDAELNYKRIIELGVSPILLTDSGELPEIPLNAIIIDALVGTGLTKPLEGIAAELVIHINKLRNLKVSIDTPSGFFTDSPMPDNALAIHAQVTLSFQVPKLMFFFSESEQYLGEWHLLDIGLASPEQINLPAKYYLLMQDIQKALKKRNRFSHKGTFGHALICGGSDGKIGAVILAAKSCLRSGVGLTTVYSPGMGVMPLQTAVPESMVIRSDAETHISGNLNPEHFSAIGFGPGAGVNDDTAKVLKSFIQQKNAPLVIDADGLNILSENLTWLAFLPDETILTPHPGEFDRMAGKHKSEYERWLSAKEFARLNNCIVVLKGAHTTINSPDGSTWFNSTGNPGMATGGSGDVLTGIITGLLAQGYAAIEAAKIGVFLHGVSGDLAEEALTEEGMKAGDLIEFLPAAWKAIQEIV
jgi:hydroxyethylthiazole kinase-like uncharacterized protein yjeF